MYRPGEWEQLPSERDLNPFSRYEALDPKRPIVLDDIENGTITVKTQHRPQRSPLPKPPSALSELRWCCLKLDIFQTCRKNIIF